MTRAAAEATTTEEAVIFHYSSRAAPELSFGSIRFNLAPPLRRLYSRYSGRPSSGTIRWIVVGFITLAGMSSHSLRDDGGYYYYYSFALSLPFVDPSLLIEICGGKGGAVENCEDSDS
mmetsp:Transcript_22062/g.65347  ORF Transcript_22062/g.65347 Transcript_22062/m.65347 type:complete len:118 (-) Transcript_22062:83-436(-)